MELLNANRVAQSCSRRAADRFRLINDGAKFGLDRNSIEWLTFINPCLIYQSSVLQREQSRQEQKVTAFDRRYVTVESRTFGSLDDFALGIS